MIWLAFVMAILSSPARAAEPANVELLTPGQFHGHEVSAKSGERWWALTRIGDSFVLEETTIDLQTVRDEIIDHGTEAKTGKRVQAWGRANQVPIFLVRGLSALRAGPVEGQVPEPDRLNPGESLLLFASRPFPSSLFALGRATFGGAYEPERVIRDYELWLQHGKDRQRIAASPGLDEAPPKILWSGDLDRDGHADLLIDLGFHENVTEYVLFLSSLANPGELVGRAASFRHGGC